MMTVQNAIEEARKQIASADRYKLTGLYEIEPEQLDGMAEFLDTIEVTPELAAIDDPDDLADLLYDQAHEWADGETSMYTAHLLDWYGENLNRMWYADEAMRETSPKDFFGVLAGGQYAYHAETARCAVELLRDTMKASAA